MEGYKVWYKGESRPDEKVYESLAKAVQDLQSSERGGIITEAITEADGREILNRVTRVKPV